MTISRAQEEASLPADLHVHTTFSDSTLTPREVIQECLWHGIDTVAITDHDTIEGVADAIAEGEEVGVRVIPGVEMTAYDVLREIHIVGLFIDIRNEHLLDVLARGLEARRLRVFEIVRLLRKLDVNVSAEEVFQIAGAGAPGRPHVARAMVRHGHVQTFPDAFKYYIGNDGPAYVPKYQLTAAQVVGAIHGAGGVSVVAHPGARLPDESVRELIAGGVDAIEVYHPLHTYDKEKKYLKMAEELGALISGGSDSHGIAREWSRIGAVYLGRGLLHKLELRAQSRRPKSK